jgi:homoserine O-succinyltransferase
MERENIFVMAEKRAEVQDIRPIEIALLNLMPTKIETETQIIRLLSYSPLQVSLTLLNTATHESKNTSRAHLDKFYKNFKEVSRQKFDGMIITGAPVETMEFEEVDYWAELREILKFSQERVTSNLFICWGAQAALYHLYGIRKRVLAGKLSGIFANRKLVPFDPLLKGMDDVFYIPQSRHTECVPEELTACSRIEVLADSEKAGPSVLKSRDDKNFFLFGHSEYDRDTLRCEYERDKAKGLAVRPPENYFGEKGEIEVTWRSAASLLFSNWLNYYVYQVTPYDRESIR